MSPTCHLPGSLFSSVPCAGHWRATAQGSTQFVISEESGNALHEVDRIINTALLRGDTSITAQKIKSLCCAAAGITAPVSATAEALIPHKKLREAAHLEVTLNAQNRPPAQLAKETLKKTFRFGEIAA
jgi:hypothetical protein